MKRLLDGARQDGERILPDGGIVEADVDSFWQLDLSSEALEM
jgi:hypothetical protein